MRDYRDKQAWRAYLAEKAKGYPYSGSAAFKLEDWRGKLIDSPSFAFVPYWLALELVSEGKKDALKVPIDELLAKCKKSYMESVIYNKKFKLKPDTYKGHPLNWEIYRPTDEYNNSCDSFTEKCVIPEKLNEEEKKELYEQIYERFYDPYCDGRDCTGVWFTGWIKILTTTEKTFIYHHKVCDC